MEEQTMTEFRPLDAEARSGREIEVETAWWGVMTVRWIPDRNWFYEDEDGIVLLEECVVGWRPIEKGAG
jgi:hypothetical protein